MLLHVVKRAIKSTTQKHPKTIINIARLLSTNSYLINEFTDNTTSLKVKFGDEIEEK